MARSFTQVPPDSTGDKLTMQTFTVASDTFHTQGVYLPGLPTYRSVTADITPANSKWHTYLFNASGSAQSVYILGIRYYNNVTAVTGVVNRFDIRRSASTTPTGGASITPIAHNSADPALANVTAYGGATGGITDGSIVESIAVSSEEHTATTADVDRLLQQMPMLSPLYPWGRPMTLRPGEGIGVKQNGAGTVGTLQWIVDFAVEAD
jgi:hypothetical protein